MRKNINVETIEGYVFDHSLEIKTVANEASENYGKEFISGEVMVATNEEGTNVVPVHYTYVTATTKKGGANKTFTVLKKIIDSNSTWTSAGKEKAIKVKLEPSLALNDWYDKEGNLVSNKRNEGGFATIVTKLNEKENERATFKADMVITSVKRVEANEEKGISADYCVIRGVIFDFRNAILPVDFTVRSEAGMEYFENLGATSSEPVYTKVWGQIKDLTIVQEITEESAFGEASVRVVQRKQKDWIITGTSPTTYEFGDEEFITAEELKKAMQDRELYLAAEKKRTEEYRNGNEANAIGDSSESKKKSGGTKKVEVSAADFNF